MKNTSMCALRVTVDQRTAALLDAIKARTGLSHAEQVRQSLRLWLDVHERQKTSLEILKRS